MGDIVKRTGFYEVRERAGKKIFQYYPFYLVEVEGQTQSQLFQPVNFQDRNIGSWSGNARVQVDEYKQYDPGMRLFMDGNIQLMKFQSCELPWR